MEITLIAALSKNKVIGNEGAIPWRIPKDMKRFRELTMGHPVIMGRKTWDSIDEEYKPLKGRKNIILSRSMPGEEGIYVARDIEEAIGFTEGQDSYVGGGEDVYRAFLPHASKMELTEVQGEYEGDSFFPKIDFRDWRLANREEHFGDLSYFFSTYVRK